MDALFTVGTAASVRLKMLAEDGSYQFEITAVPGNHLSLATMFVQSNDWFFSVNNLPLFDARGNQLQITITPVN